MEFDLINPESSEGLFKRGVEKIQRIDPAKEAGNYR
jgi:hypothetical protein